MVCGDGDADHTVTFRWRDGEEANAYAVTKATLSQRIEAWVFECLFPVCMQHMSAMYNAGTSKLVVAHLLHVWALPYVCVCESVCYIEWT